MFNIGAGELIFILVAALLVLGPQKLPEFARAIGKFVREFRRQTDEVRTVVEREFYKMDQEFQDEPRPRLPGPIPAARPPVAPPEVLGAQAPAEGSAAAGAEPPPGEALSASEAPPGEAPSAEAPPAEAPPAEPEGLPRLEPIPGTVARNAPKGG
jgi:sec-independent protein translocase protein TatB